MKLVVGFVLGAAATVLGEYVARSILAHAEMRAAEEKPELVPPYDLSSPAFDPYRRPASFEEMMRGNAG
jgi:hypothetical protein